MRPGDRELDDEIKGHLALEIQERIERGEDPESARLNALRQFGYVPQMREEMRRIWYSRWFDMIEALVQDIRVGFRSLLRAKGLAATVVVTLALGIGANAAIFSVIRGVLLRPLVNRGEDRLVYIGQGATGAGVDNATFSVPEVKDIRASVKAFSAIGEFSTVDFTLIGLGEPRIVRAGVVNGEYFDVMGLKPILGRLIEPSDDGRDAAGVAVLTHRFWTESLNSDPSVVGKIIRLDKGNATVIGVLEPSVPYPADTELIANIVTSPHHLSATMESQRTHRMTQLFGRLRPEATMESARVELNTVRDAMVRDNPADYNARLTTPLQVRRLRDQIASPARNMLLLLLAAAAIVFIIACSNVANLILARSVRREGELMVRAALGASKAALRRTLLAESLVLCGAGAALGILLARPMVSIVARFAARFSVRALEVTVDGSLLWVGSILAMAAAILLAYVPKLPSAHAPGTSGLAAGSIRVTPSTRRRLKIFATTQIAFSFVMLAGATTLITTLIALQTSTTGYDMRQVLAIDVPAPVLGFAKPDEIAFYREMLRKVDDVPGVDGVSMGMMTPWREKGVGTIKFTVDGFTPANGEELPRARFRVVTPGFFKVLGVPMYEGRDFTDEDRMGGELVAVVSQSFAQRMFPNGDALNHHMWWVDPFFGKTPMPRRIIGIVADVDDENVVRGPAVTVYQPSQQLGVIGGRLFVHAAGDPYALVQPVTRTIRAMAPNQPVERASTLEDIRSEVLTPQRLNAFVLSGFAGVALLIAVVGVSGVLAFGVSARTREFGVRLAIGSSPSELLRGVLSEGIVIVSIGIVVGAAFGYVFAGVAASYFTGIRMPGLGPLLGAAVVLVSAAVAASLMPAARASRVDVLQALRSE